MRIPKAASPELGVNYNVPEIDDPASKGREDRESDWRPRSRRRFGTPSASRASIDDAPHETSGQRGQEGASLTERATYCPRGKAFYRCANGFLGCCSHDPCNPGGTCSESQKSGQQKKTSTSAAHAQRSTTHVTTSTSPLRHTTTVTHHTQPHSTTKSVTHTTHHSTSSSTTSRLSASQTETSSPTPSSGPAMRIPPACPRGNSTHYMDSSNVEYEIYCEMENTFVSYNALYVSNGGYAECFSACSKTNGCAGFTFIGSGSGNCYEKAQMPNNTYLTHEGSNYVTATKLDSPNNTGTGATSSKKSGIIAGAVIGSILLVVLLLWLIACCAKRHRKKVEERRATITHVIQGPIEMQPYRPSTDHHRQGSTSHDFQQYNGGTTPSTANTATKGNDQVGNRSPPGLFGLEQTWRQNQNGDFRPESGFIPMVLPASMYQTSPSPYKQDFVRDDNRTQPGSRSPRFHEQLQEQSREYSQRIPSTIDSPTLGLQPTSSRSFANDARRNQHLANAMPARSTPSPKSPSPVSPVLKDETVISGFKVSPVHNDGNRWREI